MPDRRSDRAVELDQRLEEMRSGLRVESPKELSGRIRYYLQRLVETQARCEGNNPPNLVRCNEREIWVGPAKDKGPTDEHFKFSSGARLSFTITLCKEGHAWRLLGYRFDLRMPEGSNPPFFRFDLNRAFHKEPSKEPLCHFHPGKEDLRLPSPVLHPLAVLDYLILEIEPAFTQ